MGAMTAEDRDTSDQELHYDEQHEESPRGRGKSHKLFYVLSIVGVLVLVGAGIVYISGAGGAESGRKLLTTAAKRANLIVTVTEDGNVESARNLELKCEVPGPITILNIIQDGTHVEKGAELVRLDSSLIEDQVNAQKIVVATAEAKKITEERTWAAAKIAVEEYREGTFKQLMEQSDADITVARQNLSSAENTLHYTERMHRKGYATPLELESKEYAVAQAKLTLGVAQTTKMVLEKYTRAKMLEELESARDSAEALMRSAQAEYDLQMAKLERLERQMSKCLITAPQSGMVVYANDSGGWRSSQQGPKIDLGASVNEFQAILRLPDLSNMQVKALVHESKVERLRIGMRAVVKIQDRQLQGTVASIANQAEPTSFFSGNVKEYATIIKIDGHPEGLKPGMTAEIEVLVDERRDVLTVPVQCVVELGNKFYSWVRKPGGVERREVILGATNDTEIEIKDGIKEGELVLQNPRAEISDARSETMVAEDVDIKKKFGDAPPGAAASQSGGRVGSEMAGGQGGPDGGRGRGEGGRGGGQRPRMSFSDLDKDKDGKLTQEEMPEQARPFFARMDADGNGFVDRAEHKAMEDRRKQMQQGGGPGGAGGPGGPGGFSGGGAQ
jgi:RND family efflux transporter MFP subunit